ncbi:hypothetical protein [Rhizobium herbae]
MSFKQKAWLAAFIIVTLALATRYLVLNEPGEFSRFNEILQSYVALTLLALIILSFVGLLFLLSQKVAPARQEQIVTLYSWGSSIFVGTVMVAAVVYAKLST